MIKEDKLEMVIIAYKLYHSKLAEYPNPTPRQRGAITGRWNRFRQACNELECDPDKLAAVLGRQLEANND